MELKQIVRDVAFRNFEIGDFLHCKHNRAYLYKVIHKLVVSGGVKQIVIEPWHNVDDRLVSGFREKVDYLESFWKEK